MNLLFRIAMLFTLFVPFVPAGAADVGGIVLKGAFATPFTLDGTTLKPFARSSVGAKDHGVEGRWEGVDLIDVLRKAGAPLDDKLRGKALTQVLVVEARDGYRAVFALAEFDPAFGGLKVLLADTRDGAPLDVNEGRYRLVIASEQRQARWVRQVSSLELRSLD